jgi:hypothetical protein
MRWLDDLSMDLRKMGVSRWRDKARNREAWRHIVEEAKPLPRLYSCLEERKITNYILCVCVFVALVIQHAKCLCHILL